MRKLFVPVVSAFVLASLLAACSPSLVPMAGWSPRDYGDGAAKSSPPSVK